MIDNRCIMAAKKTTKRSTQTATTSHSMRIGGPLQARDASGLPWELAPATSHVESFRFYDQRKYKLLKQSEIHVRFRDGSEYAYYSTSPAVFEEIFRYLRSAPHPGEVIWTLLRDRFPYRQIVARSRSGGRSSGPPAAMSASSAGAGRIQVQGRRVNLTGGIGPFRG